MVESTSTNNSGFEPRTPHNATPRQLFVWIFRLARRGVHQVVTYPSDSEGTATYDIARPSGRRGLLRSLLTREQRRTPTTY